MRFLPGAVLALLACLTIEAGAHAAPEREIMIDQVEVTGVKVLAPEAVENSVEISTGEPLDQAKVVRSAQNLQAQYQRIGYEQVSIKTRLERRPGPGGRLQNILDIAVVEGKPTRIAGFQFMTDSDSVSYVDWKKLEKMLMARVKLKSGDVLDEETLSDVRRGVQEVLTSEEFIGSKMDDVRAIPTDPPKIINPEFVDGTGRWVRLEFHLNLGDRVTFGFRGNTVISSTHLTALVDEQRLLGLGTDYIGAIRSRIEEEYRSLGFAHVHIEVYSFEPKKGGADRHIRFVINEGPRVQIGSITFDGNIVFTEKQLLEQFNAVAPSIVQKGYYVEKDVRKAAELVVEWIKSKGYLSAKLVTISASYPPKPRASDKDSEVRLVIYIYESDQTLLRTLNISGVQLFDRSEVERILGVHEGEPLNLFAFSEGLEALKSAYRAKGHLNMTILNEGKDSVVRYSEDNHFAEVTLEVNEGPQYRVGRVEIEGRVQTQESVIEREMLLKPGDIVSEPKLAQSEANLRRLGIFSTVKVRATPDTEKADTQNIRVTVEEAPPGVVAGGPGFRNDLGVRAFGEVGYTNLWGLNHSVFFDASANRRVDNTYRFVEYQTQLAYNWPWFKGWDVTFRPTISLTGTQYYFFDAVTAATALNWQKQLLRSPNLSGIFTYSLERVNQFNAKFAQDEGFFTIGAITPTLRLDMRDNPLAPTSGLFVQTSFEWADPFFLSQRHPTPIGYTRFQFRTDYDIPLTRGMVWLLSFRTGIERSTKSQEGDSVDGAIPLIKQFALGGIGSLRGFSEQELNFQDTNVLGSMTYVNYRTQIDLPVAGSLKIGPFLDAANLNTDHFSFGNLRMGTGFGIRYITPVGPVNLDYGFKINPQPGESASEFYFSIGVI